MPYPISVIVHTRNEERNIEDCLLSVHGWADEIIVMDMESTDQTCEIAKKYADKILHHPCMMIPEPARNKSLAEAKNEWAFFLDADERATPELKKAIETIIWRHGHEAAAVQLPYKNIVFGRWIEHAGGWWPGYKAPLLVKKGKVSFAGEVHAVPAIDGHLVRLNPGSDREAVEHFTYRTVAEWIEKANRYTTLEVPRFTARGEPTDWRRAAEAFGAQLRMYYDQTSGKLDGMEGWWLSLCCAVYELLSHVKYWEHTRDAACLPPSAADFMAVAAKAAGASDVGSSAPGWLAKLVSLLGKGERIYAPDLPGLANAQGPSDADTVLVWNAERLDADRLTELVGSTHTGALMVFGYPISPETAELRDRFEDLFGATFHILDPDPETERVLLFGWAGRRVDADINVLLTLHSSALAMMGGGETLAFRTLLVAAREQRVRADVSVSLRVEPHRYDLVHVVSLFQTDHASTIARWGKKTVVTPIWWDGPRVQWVANVLPAVLSPDRTPVEREKLLALYAARTLEANGVKMDDAKFEDEDLAQLTRVRDLADRIVATGPEELREMERSLGETKIPSDCATLGFEPVLSTAADARVFQEKFGLTDFVLCVGRIEPMKNQAMLAYALRDTGRKLVLMGAAPDPAYLALCKHWGGENFVHIPNQPQAMVASAYKAASCHALPSWWEVPGLATIEAAAAGCPVVASDCGTIRYHLAEAVHYCDPADPDSIRSAVLAALSEKGRTKWDVVGAHAFRDLTHVCSAAQFRTEYEKALGLDPVRFLLIPDWNADGTWQPPLEAYLSFYHMKDRVTLCLLVDEPTGESAVGAMEKLSGYCRDRGFDPALCADVELTDLASVGEVAAVVSSGSQAEEQLQPKYNFTPLDWRNVWRMRETG